ncbi:hypothetical protein RHGRI_025173 [Rhododendron griersonianum]|uniref:Nucleoside diphosphate kinase-like domain-containing protein n=1 Tax=Rhododendron griersonianum TaxID=479676 RepID=A0AAV6JA92_9ERIC|nr:hypothetical protein RHGRI_025173 [Rhododendron griersonianum]
MDNRYGATLQMNVYIDFIGDGSKEKEKTLAIIKPDGLAGNHTNKIKEIILDSGFSISKEMIVQLDEDSVKRFYVEHSSKSFFPSLLKYMTSGPVLIMVLEKENAVADWRAMIGPTDARKAKITHPYRIHMTLEFVCHYNPSAVTVKSSTQLNFLGFFNWMQNKFNGVQGSTSTAKPNNPVFAPRQPKHEPPKEEFSDWPHGLLAIGTFGNQNTNQTSDQRQQNPQQHQSPSSSDEDELADFTPEEVGKLQKELTKLLRRKPAAPATTQVEGDIQNAADLPLDRFLNCPSSLEVSRRISTVGCSVSGDKDDEDIDRTIRVIIDRCKDVCMEKNRKALGKKSVSFLFKKFVCSSGFGPSPSFRDTFQESRMEKLLRTMLSKKMYPQNCSRASSVKKILEDRPTPKMIKGKEEEEKRKKTSDGSKWVKTDSD